MDILTSYQTGDLSRIFRNHQPHTRANYCVAIRHFGRFLGRPAKAGDLTSRKIRRCMTWLYADGLREVGTVNQFRTIMQVIGNALHETGHLSQRPAPPMFKRPRSPMWKRPQLTDYPVLGRVEAAGSVAVHQRTGGAT